MSAIDILFKWLNKTRPGNKIIHESEKEVRRLQAIEAKYERALQALHDIAHGVCDNDGRGCHNEDIAYDALQLLGELK